MPETAYDLQYFASNKETKQNRPQLKVVQKKPSRVGGVLRAFRNWLVFSMFVCLTCSVLYTQTVVTELQTQISQKNQELVEQEALNAYLSFELESMTTPKAVEQRAAELGLVPLSSNQIAYVQVQEENEIEVAPSFLEQFGANLDLGLKTMLDHVNPQ